MKPSTLALPMLITLGTYASATHAAIDRIAKFDAGGQPTLQPSAQCEDRHTLVRGRSERLRVFGAWTDFTNRVTATGGVTGRTLRTNASPPWVDIELTAPLNATLGRRNVTLSYPAGSDSFQVLVLDTQTIDSLTPSATPGSSFTSVSVEIRGRNLPQSLSTESTLSTSGFEPSLLAGGVAGGSIKQQRVLRQSATTARVEFEFYQPMERAVLNILLSGSDPCFGKSSFGFNNASISAGTSNVVVAQAANVDNRNFVTDIRLDNSTLRPSVGSPVTILLTLKYPVPQTSPLINVGINRNGLPRQPTARGETIYYRFIPGQSFRIDGRTLSSTQFESMVVAPGQREAKITALIASCPASGKVTSANFTIQTVMHNINAQSAPERVDRSFSVTCPQQ